MVGDDARLFGVVADAGERALAERASVVDAEADAI